ncbi:MAG: hypothetical protein HYT87_16730 [Nitrospirae bacterium]|nr:hypothetical protein [Nitrospirota bacterium]
MKDLQPGAYPMEKALRWISEQRTAFPNKPLTEIIHETARKFDLAPKDEEFLLQQLLTKKP